MSISLFEVLPLSGHPWRAVLVTGDNAIGAHTQATSTMIRKALSSQLLHAPELDLFRLLRISTVSNDLISRTGLLQCRTAVRAGARLIGDDRLLDR